MVRIYSRFLGDGGNGSQFERQRDSGGAKRGVYNSNDKWGEGEETV